MTSSILSNVFNFTRKIMRHLLIFTLFSFFTSVSYSQTISDKPKNIEISLSRDSLRVFFGTFEFAPQFKMDIFSLNGKVFAQRVGDVDKFQIFPKQINIFFLTAMEAELEFTKSTKGSYDTLLLHQDGKNMKAFRISSKPSELYDTILHLDSLLYSYYNARNIKKFISLFSPDFEFYHDQTGKTNYKENLKRFKVNFTKSTIMRRELLKSSLEIYPIKDFGAIQIGTHNFYQTEKGGQEKLVAQPKFLHIWMKKNNVWQITKVISYDH
jgi:hypothetical protein